MYTINIAKADSALEIDFDALPEVSRQYVINYGLTQCLNDAVASIPKGEPAANVMAKVNKKFDALVDGTVRVAGTRVADPMRAEAIEIAIDRTIRGQFKKAGKALEPKAMRAAAIALVERNPAYMHIAEANARDRAKNAAMFADALGEADIAALEPKNESTALVPAA